MNTPLQSIAGASACGADVLREQLRWVAAERRWHPAADTLPPDHRPPVFPPLGHSSLQRGAMLTRLTTARAWASAEG